MVQGGVLCFGLFLGILAKGGLLYLLESNYHAWFTRFVHLIEATVRIGKDDLGPSSDGSFVIVSGADIRYDPLWLDHFGFSLNAAAVYPHLEFCQWYCSHFNYSTAQCDSGYSRIWSNAYSLRPEYDIFHQNPLIFHVPDVSYVFSRTFDIGAYHVTPDLAAEGARTRLPILPPPAAANFSLSPLSRIGWRSVGCGWLHRSYTGYLTPSFSDRPGFWPVVRNFFQSSVCEPGSMRIEFETFDPPVVTALGFRRGNTIGRALFDGETMGLIAAGKKTSAEILQPAFNRRAFWTWVGRIVSVVIGMVACSMLVPENSLLCLLICGDILLGIALRCSQWSGRFITGIFGLAAAACITSGLVGFLQAVADSGRKGY
jgi:hypothetical protein